MRGPLPNEKRRRTNAPSIANKVVPAEGRKGRAPALPAGKTLGRAGKAFWKWAWASPLGCDWVVAADTQVVWRRASLEDDLEALDKLDVSFAPLFADVLDADLSEMALAHRIDGLVGRLKSLAGGRRGVLAEMRLLDAQLGLTPRARREQRLTIALADEVADEAVDSDEIAQRREERERRLAEGV